MKTGNIIKLIVGLAVIVIQIVVCLKLVDMFADMISGDGNAYDDDYTIETPEPMPTMPDYMMEDSFYDDAESPDINEQGIE